MIAPIALVRNPRLPAREAPPIPPNPHPLEAALIVGICFGWFIAISVAAVAAGFPRHGGGRFDDASLIWLIVTELVLGSLALVVLRARGYVLSELLPTPTWRGCGLGLLLYVVAAFAWSAVAHLFPLSELARQPVAEMVSERHVTLPVIIALGMVNGLYEETALLGYLQRGFRAAGASFAIGLSVLVRVLYHLYQGPIGALSMLVYGIVVGLFYWRTGKLWPAVFAHTLADALALA